MTQRDEARHRANQVRTERARSKRELKLGLQQFSEALNAHYWQNASLLEVLGYALVERPQLIGSLEQSMANHRPPRRAAHTALHIAAKLGFTHMTLVRDLSPSQKWLAAEAVRRYPRMPTPTSGAGRSAATIVADSLPTASS